MSTIIGADAPISTGFIPRRLQLELRANLRRFNVIVCHRRFGKTVFQINHQIDKMMRSNLPAPRMAYIAPTFGQAKRVAWDYYKKYAHSIPGTVPHEQDLRLDFNHNAGRISLLSGEDYARIKGIYLDDGTLDEFGEMDPAVWTEAVRPTLSDRRGCVTFIGTPKGQNTFHKLYEYATQSGDPEWFGAMYKASETGIIDQAELDSARRTMSEDEYEQEYECSFNAGLTGAYFARELAKAENEGRIGNFPHDPNVAVDTYWDLGTNDLMAVWFIQSSRGRHRCIDYYEVAGSDIPSCAIAIKKKNYSIGRLVLPHDAKAKNYQTGKEATQIFYEHFRGVPQTIIPRVSSKMISINAARTILPLVEFDRVKCKRGLEALKNYQSKWDAKNNVFQENPLHNWASNGSDAFQQFALGNRPDSRNSDYQSDQQGRLGTRSNSTYNPFGTFGRGRR